MPVSTTTKTDWVDGDNDVIVSTSPINLKAVEIQCRGNSALADAFVRLYDSADATVGTTEPVCVIYIPRQDTTSTKRRLKVIYGGLRFATGLTMGVYTTPHSGTTSTVSTSAPLSVKIFYN